MDKKALFENLFIFEMANNHQGDIEHGLKILNAFAKIKNQFSYPCAIKFQLRNLDTFIHPDFQSRTDLKMIKRFQSTKLNHHQFLLLVEHARELGFKTMATVFDEDSIDFFKHANFDYLKIASCSAMDYPLLKSLANIDKPKILSTAGMPVETIQNSLKLLNMKVEKGAIMHCVGIYPTPYHELSLDRIDQLVKLYPQFPIGYSTHENPEETLPMAMVVAKGVRLIEKHIDIQSENYQINKYSLTPEQMFECMQSYEKALSYCHYDPEKLHKKEAKNLISLKRGVFASQKLKSNDQLNNQNCFFALPSEQDQLTTDLFENNHIKLLEEVSSNQTIKKSATDTESENLIHVYYQKALNLLRANRIELPADFKIEVSCHYGIEQFEKQGAVLITVLSEVYCKKYIVLFEGQVHPEHFHPKRNESLNLISGQVELSLNNFRTYMKQNKFYKIPAKTWHELRATQDSIIEEITILDELQSVYRDQIINDKLMDQRKIKAIINKGEWVYHEQDHSIS